MNSSLEKRLIFFSFLVLFFSILVNTGMDIFVFRKDYLVMLQIKAQNLGNIMKEELIQSQQSATDTLPVQKLEKICREISTANPDIAYCAVTNPTGMPLVVSDQHFQNLPFPTAVANPLQLDGSLIQITHDGVQYREIITKAATPGHEVSYLIHIGFREKLVTGKMLNMLFRSLAVFIFFLAVTFSMVVMFIRRNIIKPVSMLLEGVKKISGGSFDFMIRETPNFEFNELARNINQMSGSLKTRDDELQKHLCELEGTHKKLHSSYRQLENLSLELEKSEEMYKLLLEYSSDAIVVLDDMEVVIIVNKKAEQFFGYTIAELVGLPLTKLLLLLNLENIAQIHQSFQEAVDGRQFTEELSFIRKDGSKVCARFYVSAIESGEERLYQLIFRDITREKETLQNLSKSAADLIRLNRMKDSFLGLASHELKTPLTIILGYTELISGEMEDQLDQSTMEMVQNIRQAALRLDNIVRDMVDVTMIDEKRLQLRQDSISLNKLVETTANEFRIFFTKRSLQLVLNLDQSIPSITGDYLRLTQLLSNVLVNAIKFTPDGGRITISSIAKYLPHHLGDEKKSRVVFDQHPEQLFIDITVSDTGIGIDLDDQVRIFDKFYESGRIEEHSTGQVSFLAKGAGLGLAIAKGIAQIHGGEIWVESAGCNEERCPGSTFHILLPVDPPKGDKTLDYLSLVR